MLAYFQHEQHQLDADLALHVQQQQQRRDQRGQWRRCAWVRQWIGCCQQSGVYRQLMVELCCEDPTAFKNFMKMAPEMYAEIMVRVEHHITKQFTRLQQPM